MSEPVLEARKVVKWYEGPVRRVEVLRELDLAVHAGEAVAVVGDSGVGKSTLLHVLGALDAPQGGAVLFEGRDVFALAPAETADYRNRAVGFVFQFHHLLPEFTAVENVEMPFRVGRRRPEGAAERTLERLGLSGRLDHLPGQLSGGEQQRVAIARAVAPGPRVVLADEPTGNLDPGTGAVVFALLRELQAERGFALVVATHSGRVAAGCDRVLRMDAGKLTRLDEHEARAYFDDGGSGAPPAAAS